jgi:uncharacterized protein YbjQ (UPF0145 family)
MMIVTRTNDVANHKFVRYLGVVRGAAGITGVLSSWHSRRS